MTIAALALLLAVQQGGATTPPVPVQRGIVVQPETVTVGDPFRVIVRVRAPRGATVDFPSAVDSGLKVESLDPVSVQPGTDSSVVEQTATYRLAAWDIGRLPIRLADIVVRQADVTRRLPFGDDVSIEVASVLPADSAQRVPKAPRPLIEFGPPWWLWLLVGLIAAALVGLLWWWWRRRRAPASPPLDAYALAQREFARVEALELVASGERGQHVALMADVVRDYLAREVAPARTSLTTGELAHALRVDRRVPVARLLSLLHEVDLVKFAGAPVSADRASAIGLEARAIVDAVHSAITAPSAQEAA